jgi:poly[(R)-3-hydroxyalkanoate] polymerase subunit PhaC
MNSTPPSADAQGYLENLMRAGQEAMKQFDSALISTMGVSGKAPSSSGNPLFPVTLAADLQRDFFKQLWQFWNAVFLNSFAGGAHSKVALARGDKRFKDESWREQLSQGRNA